MKFSSVLKRPFLSWGDGFAVYSCVQTSQGFELVIGLSLLPGSGGNRISRPCRRANSCASMRRVVIQGLWMLLGAFKWSFHTTLAAEA